MWLAGMTRLNRARQVVKDGLVMTATKSSMAGLLHQWFYKRVEQHVGYAVCYASVLNSALYRVQPFQIH